jgi:predicted HNH restriction endonuclease
MDVDKRCERNQQTDAANVAAFGHVSKVCKDVQQ